MSRDKRYALLGGNVSHSLSKKLHGMFADYEYDLISIDSREKFETVLADRSYDGFNITIPFKKNAADLVDELSPEAEAVGAVNTVKRLDDGRLKGYNTDIPGFMELIGPCADGRKVLILGSGGASAAAREGLRRLGASEVMTVSRHPELLDDVPSGSKCAYKDISMHYDAEIIVNATPVGMYPNNGMSPLAQAGIRSSKFSHLELAADLIYDPYRTRFLIDAENNGVRVVSGHKMLIYQALYANEIWSGISRTVAERDRTARRIMRDILEAQLNVAVIGMPGSGKSSISRQFAKITKRPFIDIDREIKHDLGEDISDVIGDPERGEDFFRRKETGTIMRICRESGQVIATGGGSILRRVNRDRLRENSIVVYIKRPSEMLAVKGRPLSASNGVAELYRKRGGTYRSMANVTVLNEEEFGSTFDRNGNQNSYRYDMKRFVYRMIRSVERYLDEIADN